MATAAELERLAAGCREVVLLANRAASRRDAITVQRQIVQRHTAALDTLCESLAPGVLSRPWPGGFEAQPAEVLDAAEYLRAGTLRMSLGDAGAVQAPLIVPWLNHGNLVVRAPDRLRERTSSLLQDLLLRSLFGTGAGQVALSSFDPDLSSTLAMFAQLRQAKEDLVTPPLADPTELRALLDELARDVRRITDMYGGERTDLGRFRRSTGQPIETYRVVTIQSYPRGFDEDLNARLVTLLKTGPACGISFLIHHDPGVPVPDRVDSSEVLKAAAVLDLEAGTATGHETFDIRFGTCPPAAVVEPAIAALSARVRNAAAPKVDFGALQPDTYWAESSVERIAATIGRRGHQAIEIVLGDEVEQKHNVLVTGAVGQGKSNLLMAMIHSWAIRYSPSELVMYLLDFKDGVTLYPLARHGDARSWLPHARVLGLESDRPYGLAVLKYLVEEFERRATIIKPFGDNLTRFRRQRPDVEMPRIVVVIDEFQVLLEDDDEIAAEAVLALDRLARRGRAYGIHLVLASQTLSGITALMAKRDGIFSQFPIRLALYNSAAESRATLSQTNTEAARLRYRGEIVVNRDFGEVEANSRGVVAFAEPAELVRIRQALVERDGARHVPATFDGGSQPAYGEEIPTGQPSSEPAALLGLSIGVDPSPVWVGFGDEPGRHLSILGTGKRPNGRWSPPAEALNVVARSLADTSPLGAARFLVLDTLADGDPDLGAVSELEASLLAAGVPTLRYRRATISAGLAELDRELQARQESQGAGGPLFAVVFGGDRIPRATTFDVLTGTRPLDTLHTIWREGAPLGVHLLGWWGTPKIYRDHTVNYGVDGLVDVMMMFRVPPDAVIDAFGPFVTWASPECRALVRDVRLSSEPAVLIPPRPSVDNSREASNT